MIHVRFTQAKDWFAVGLQATSVLAPELRLFVSAELDEGMSVTADVVPFVAGRPEAVATPPVLLLVALSFSRQA